MEELASELLKELNCDTAFSIKLPAGLLSRFAQNVTELRAKRN